MLQTASTIATLERGKSCFECGLMWSRTGGAGAHGVQGIGLLLWCFCSSSFTASGVKMMSAWCQRYPVENVSTSFFVLPLFAVRFLCVLARIRDWSPRPRRKECDLKSAKQKQKERERNLFAFTLYIEYKAMHHSWTLHSRPTLFYMFLHLYEQKRFSTVR